MACKKARGKRAKTRDKLKRKFSKLSVSRELADVMPGTKAQITIDSAMHSGMPSPRYQGKTVDVVGKQGSLLDVMLKEGRGEKHFLVHPAHLTFPKRSEAA